MNALQATRPLERRLTVSYLIAFGIVLAVFALGVHVAFALDLHHDNAARVSVLLDMGRSALEIKEDRTFIDAGRLQIAPQSEGIGWYDAAGREIAHRGLGDANASDDLLRASRPITINDPMNGRVPAQIHVVLSREPSQRGLQHVDIVLIVGLFGGLAAAGIGGRYLARRAIARVVRTMRTLSDFTADAAHELRGPLAALASNASASLRDADDLSAEHRRRLTTIAATAGQMSHTVDDLLLLARAETPIERELFAIDLGACIAGAIEARRALAHERSIALEFTPVHARIYGNPNEIERIFGNLLDNALRYTPAGGRVDVGAVHERGGISVRIADTGIGIAPDALPRIFERFWRGDDVRSAQNGSGLGLAIARALARRHGGDVTARSVQNAGSEFSVWLPDRPPKPLLHDISTIS